MRINFMTYTIGECEDWTDDGSPYGIVFMTVKLNDLGKNFLPKWSDRYVDLCINYETGVITAYTDGDERGNYDEETLQPNWLALADAAAGVK